MLATLTGAIPFIIAIAYFGKETETPENWSVLDWRRRIGGVRPVRMDGPPEKTGREGKIAPG